MPTAGGRNIEALRLFQQIYPREAWPHNNLAASFATIGAFDEAVEEGRIAARMDPGSAIRYAVLGNSLIRLNRFGEASEIYRRALEQKLEDLSIHRGLFRIAFVNQDVRAMERQLDWAGKNSNEHVPLEWQARTAAFSGRWRRSEEYARRAAEAATRNQEPEVAAVYAAESALRGAALGRCAVAGTEASRTPSIEANASEDNQVSITRFTLALALCGETGQAQAGVVALKRRYPQNTIVNWIWLPAIQSALELLRGNAERAVDLVGPSARYEAAAEFWPQYLRGQAYLRLKRGTEAAAEFRKILDYRGQDVSSPLYPLARLGLARAMELKGDAAEARKSGEILLTDWRDADPDLPALLEARKELATWK